jgi:hypothetical protein
VALAQEYQRLMPMGADGKFVTIDFNLGGTDQILSVVMDSISSEAPESRYGQLLLEMSNVTAPGIERLLSPLVGRLNRARDQYDPQTIKKLQMAISMIANRKRLDLYYPAVLERRPDRYAAMSHYDLGSFDKGLLEFTIKKRPVFSRSDEEKIESAMMIEQLETEYGFKQAGVEEKDYQPILQEREDRRQQQIDIQQQGLAARASANGAVPA